MNHSLSDHPYYKKTVQYVHNKTALEFAVSQELFSSQGVDHGTQRLLRSLFYAKVNTYTKVLDIGCGYGPLGIALAATQPNTTLHMVDRDSLALEFASANALQNHLTNTKTYASLSYDQVNDTDFDLIVSNIPAKVGEPVLQHMLLQAQHYLLPHGTIAVVVIDAIAEFTRHTLETAENVTITYQRSWPGHHVFHYQFHAPAPQSKQSAFNSGLFFKGTFEFQWEKHSFHLDVSQDIEEYSQLSYDLQLILEILPTLPKQHTQLALATVHQGAGALAASHIFSSQQLHLIDHDQLALQTTNHNLLTHNTPAQTHHQIHWKINTPVSCFLGLIPETIPPHALSQLYNDLSTTLKPQGNGVVASSSTIITRLLELNAQQKHFEVLTRNKHKGRSVVRLRRRLQ